MCRRSMRPGGADFKWAFGPNRYILQLLGVWRTASDADSSRTFSNVRLSLTLLALTLISVAPSFHALEKVWGNITLMVDNLQFTLPLTAAAIKLFAMWSKREVLTVMNEMMLADWLKMKTAKELGIMKNWARIARIITITSNCLTYATLVWLIVIPWFGLSVKMVTDIHGIDQRFVVHTYFSYDLSKKPVFAVTYLVHTFGVILSGISYTGIDNYLIILIFHICAQFHNLNEQILNLDEFQHFRHALTWCVKEHIRLLRRNAKYKSCLIGYVRRFADIIDSSFTVMLLMLLVCFGLLFCFHGFIMISHIYGGELPLARILVTSFAVLVTFGNMCLFCVVGEILVTQSESIYYTSYEYNWYLLKPQDARCLMYLIIRANRPKYITAGKLYPMTMSTFCSLLKTSAGYISVLLANQN